MKSSESRGTGGRIAVHLILFFVLPLLFAAMYLAGNAYSLPALFEPYNLSIIIGAAAFVLFQGQFLLSARVGFLEKLLPQDRLLGAHTASGMAIGALVLSHFLLKWFLVLRWGGPTLQSALGLAALVFYAVLAPAAIFVLRGRGGRKKRSPPYAKTKAVHNLFAVAGVLVAAHVLTATSTWSPALRMFAAGWSALCLGAYVHHKIFRPQKRAALVLDESLEIAPGIHRYRFAGEPTPAAAKRRPGQFGYWSFDPGGSTAGPERTGGSAAAGEGLPGTEEHPFTISAPPGRDLEITVRSSGDFTKALPAMPKGTTVRFDGPYGGFRPRGLPEGTPLLLLAGGIGITPFLSLARDDEILRKHPMTLLWSVRDAAEAAVAAPLADAAGKGQFSLQTIFTRTAPPGSGIGNIDSAVIRRAVASLETVSGPDKARRLRVFLCGPQGFSRGMRDYLGNIGIPQRRITEERFSW